MVQYDKYMSYKEDFSMKNKRVALLIITKILMEVGYYGKNKVK